MPSTGKLVCAPNCGREVEARDLRMDEVPGRGLLRAVQELFPVDDLQYPFAVCTVGEIDAVVFRAG